MARGPLSDDPKLRALKRRLLDDEADEREARIRELEEEDQRVREEARTAEDERRWDSFADYAELVERNRSPNFGKPNANTGKAVHVPPRSS